MVAALVVAIGGGALVYALATGGEPGNRPAILADPPAIGEVATPGLADPGSIAPDFTATTLDGSTISLADQRGRTVVLNFWASWCAPCREEFPLLVEVDETTDAVVIGVVHNDIASDARAFADEMDAHWPQVLDPDRAVATAYGVRGLPQTLVIDPDGVIVDRLYGDDLAELEAMLATHTGFTPPS